MGGGGDADGGGHLSHISLIRFGKGPVFCGTFPQSIWSWETQSSADNRCILVKDLVVDDGEDYARRVEADVKPVFMITHEHWVKMDSPRLKAEAVLADTIYLQNLCS